MPYLNKRQILDLANKKQIYSDKTLVNAQIQPASLVLTLSSKCYRIKASFIPNNIKISEVIKELSLTNIDLNQNKLLENAGVAAIAGTSFGEFGEGFLRFSCASSEESIKRAIEKLFLFLSNL